MICDNLSLAVHGGLIKEVGVDKRVDLPSADGDES